MARKKKFKSEFLQELTKATLADQFVARIKERNWERKLEILKTFKGEVSVGMLAEEYRSKHTLPTDWNAMVEDLSVWAFAIANYVQVDLVEEVEWAKGFDIFSSIIRWFEENGSMTGGGPLVTALWSAAVTQYKWAANNRPSFVLSPTLSAMLQHTKLDSLPVDDLHLPYSVVILAPPQEDMLKMFGQDGCLFIAEDVRVRQNPPYESNSLGAPYFWDIRLVSSPHHHSPFGSFGMGVPGVTLEQSVLASVASGNKAWEFIEKKRESNPEAKEMLKKMGLTLPPVSPKVRHTAASYVAACMVYATMSDADSILASDSQEYSDWLKTLPGQRFTKRERKENLGIQERFETQRFYLGRQLKVINRHILKEAEEEQKSKHVSPRLHWRSGHYRRVWHGSEEERHTVVHWIKPTMVGLPQPGNEIEPRAGMM